MKRFLIALPVLLYLGLTSLYAFVVPTGESPDEPSHLQCIEQVALFRRIPVIEPQPRGDYWWSRERIISGLVCAHMPLYYLVAGYSELALGNALNVPVHYEFPPNNPQWATGESLAMFVHPRGVLARISTTPVTVIALRVQSVLFGLVTLAALYWVTDRLSRNPYTPILAMTLVAGWPQFVYMSRAITNDGLATAFAACTIATLIAPRQPGKYTLACALSALAVATKLTMIFTIPAIVLSFVIELWQAKHKRPYVVSGAGGLLIFVTLAGVLLLNPTLRDHLGWSQRTMSNTNMAALTPTYWRDVLHSSIQSGWARFGWMNVITPDGPAFLWWCMVCVTSAVGLCRVIFESHGKNRVAGLQCCIWLGGVAAIYLRININRFQPQFRYAFPAIPVLIGLAASGAEVLLLRANKHFLAVTIAAAVALLLANVWLIRFTLIPAY